MKKVVSWLSGRVSSIEFYVVIAIIVVLFALLAFEFFELHIALKALENAAGALENKL